jgi:6-phosphogluconate dehydrogenase
MVMREELEEVSNMGTVDAAAGAVGIIGLGKMGGSLARQALEKGWRVAGFTIGGPSPELVAAGLRPAAALGELRELLPAPRAVLLYIPAGRAVDALLSELESVLEPGDVVADGGNSYWGDSIVRHRRLRERGLHFVDLGTSGGVSGARQGACFMAGGDPEPIARLEPLLVSLAVPGGYVHAGPPGSGHFTKLVHNGIEFGMLQAIGEGVNLLAKYPHARLNIEGILRNWNHGSVIRSWLVELMARAYQEEGGLERIAPYVEDTGEVSWLVSDALHLEVPVPVIAQSVMQLFASRDDERPWARAIAMMRHGFGGHPYGPAPAIAEERRTGRLRDDFLEPAGGDAQAVRSAVSVSDRGEPQGGGS